MDLVLNPSLPCNLIDQQRIVDHLIEQEPYVKMPQRTIKPLISHKFTKESKIETPAIGKFEVI